MYVVVWGAGGRGDREKGKGKPDSGGKRCRVQSASISGQGPNRRARNYGRSTPYEQVMADPEQSGLHDRCDKFDVHNGILFIIGP